MQFLAGVWNFIPFREVAFTMRTTQLTISVCRRGFFHWVQVAGMWSCISTPSSACMACTGTPLHLAVHMVFNGRLIPIGDRQFSLCQHVRIGCGSQQAFCSVGMGAVSITVKWSGCEPDCPPFSAKVHACVHHVSCLI
jgi:hypothetical protein